MTITSALPSALLDPRNPVPLGLLYEPLARARVKEQHPGAAIRSIRLLSTLCEQQPEAQTHLTMLWQFGLDEAAPQ